MEQKFITILRKVIREELKTVIKNELTEILQEGLKPTVNEIKNKPVNENPQTNSNKKFKKNKFANILNETETLLEKKSAADYVDLMNEDIMMTSKDAPGFAMQRNIQQTAILEDPETGKTMKVDPTIQKAMNRDYSTLMKAIDKKRMK
jgi:hypothetical protein